MRQHTDFASYTPQTPSQQQALELMTTYAQEINRRAGETGQPTNSSRMIILHGNPGCGKSHLLEAFHKSLGDNGNQIHWIHRSLDLDFPVMAPVFFQDKPIVIIDDLFQNENLPKETEIRRLCEFILLAYQRRMLVIIATNHHVNTFIPRVLGHDSHGRVESRFLEMTRSGKNILQVEGPDGRRNETSLL